MDYIRRPSTGGDSRKGLLVSELIWEHLSKRLWGNYLQGKPISILAWGIVMVLDRDWTSTRGHKILDYVMYACFVRMHVGANVKAWYVIDKLASSLIFQCSNKRGNP